MLLSQLPAWGVWGIGCGVQGSGRPQGNMALGIKLAVLQVPKRLEAADVPSSTSRF